MVISGVKLGRDKFRRSSRVELGWLYSSPLNLPGRRAVESTYDRWADLTILFTQKPSRHRKWNNILVGVSQRPN